MRLASVSVPIRYMHRARDIRCVCRSCQVVRVYASTIATKMVDLATDWNVAPMRAIRNSVREAFPWKADGSHFSVPINAQ